ncbi:MAG: Rieske (2Fe-2S) protein [Flavobacteriales bacterium]|nr:Rieske (2Fe-2S) protein [Flavobacteriales bacterium]
MRRLEFVRKVTLGAGYVAMVGCVAACSKKTAKTEEPVKAKAEPKKKDEVGFHIDLSDPKYADLDKPGAYVYEQKLIIARTNNGDLVAYDKRCTHKGGPLAYNAETGVFQCPWHGAQFSGSGMVKKGPATSNLKGFNVERNENDVKISPKG